MTGTNLADTTAVTFGTGRNGAGLACTATSCTVTAPAGTASTKVSVQAVNAAGISLVDNRTQHTYDS
ncbi:hypothetical protein ACFY7Y_40490 [Streptomyces virginiae]|uniref:hypothetical protein n=1 Tax=Streptomyces virginiae TaxID=1961 RepID=UPI003677E3D1